MMPAMNKQAIGEANMLQGLDDYALLALIETSRGALNPAIVNAEISRRPQLIRMLAQRKPGGGLARVAPMPVGAEGMPPDAVRLPPMMRPPMPAALAAPQAGPQPMAQPAMPQGPMEMPPDAAMPPPAGFSPGGFGAPPPAGLVPDMSLAASGRDAIMEGSDQAAKVAGIGDPKQDAMMALAKAGFAMASGRSPSAIQNIAGGALLGLSDYQAAQQRALLNNIRNKQVELAHQDRAERIAARREEAEARDRYWQDSVQQRREAATERAPLQQAQTEQALAMARRADAEANAWNENRRRGGGKSATEIKLDFAKSVWPDDPQAQAAFINNQRQVPQAQILKWAQDVADREVKSGLVPLKTPDDVATWKDRRVRELSEAFRQGAPGTVPSGAAPAGQPAVPASPQGRPDKAQVLAGAKNAIAQGAKRADVEARLRQLGIDPAELER